MELKKGLKLFVDTAPIIYFIEEQYYECSFKTAPSMALSESGGTIRRRAIMV